MTNDLERILDLREVENDARRGYLFEQAIREYLPWDFRPALTMIAKGEQLDAFYEWNSWHFLVECKAKKKPIKRGSADWEDFELKLRRRHGGCIGLFASLYPVAPGIVEAADEANRAGHPCILLTGDFWEELGTVRLGMPDLLRYLVLNARGKHKSSPPPLREIQEWCVDRASLSKRLQGACRGISGTFLRRHAHSRHSELYVARDIDSAIVTAAEALRPGLLDRAARALKMKKRVVTGDQTVEYSTERAMPNQVLVVRDSSGAGKTTLAVQVALTNDPYLGLARAASELNIDASLEPVLDDGRGLGRLLAADRPLVFVVDSLDEATAIPEKRAEILSLSRLIGELNAEAEQNDLLAYPILLVFTVREDYWAHWQSVFEGSQMQSFRNLFSSFTPEQFGHALDKYARAYQFTCLADPSPTAVQALSIPFNLQVFAEANEYGDGVGFTDVFDQRVLQLYFARKGDNVMRRRVPGLTATVFLDLCSACAIGALADRGRAITHEKISQILRDDFPILRAQGDEVILAVASEGILRRDPDRPTVFEFKHSRFMEFLIARSIVRAFRNGERSLDAMTSEVFQSGAVSMFRVHDFVRFICRDQHPEVFDRLMGEYAASGDFMGAKLSRLRSGLAAGDALESADIDLVRRSITSVDAAVAWNAFFVLAAKGTRAQEDWIWDAFEAAWKGSAGSGARWKLLDRLETRGLLLDGRVLERLIESQDTREWEQFIGAVWADDGMRSCWLGEYQPAAKRLGAILQKQKGPEWEHSKGLWKGLHSGRQYIPGA